MPVDMLLVSSKPLPRQESPIKNMSSSDEKYYRVIFHLDSSVV